jgi:predicted  nucleic acid-binding Zn-ribbon protein
LLRSPAWTTTPIDGTDRAEQRIAIYHGPTPIEEREAIKDAFNGDPAKYPVRIPIATDAAREGLNLQARCWNLFQFDVPWNPSRMEQRNGRIDRKLQPHEKVFCHYFVYKQRPEDRILRALVRKTENIKKELGSLSQVIDARLADTLKHSIRHDQIDAMERDIDEADLEADKRQTVEEELEAARERQDDLRRTIDHLRNRLAEAQKSIGLDEKHFRSAISCALELMGAEPLRPVDGNGGGPPRCRFPALDQQEGADPTWADTMDTLRAPKPRDQRFWQWRKTSPIRPVIFEDPGTIDNQAAHLHLEQRVVQRLLGRFVAQGFVHHDLFRACLAQTSDAIPRVVLLGRLCLYGAGAARLHEELIPVTARWTDPKIRKGQLSPYARDAQARTMDLLEEAILLKGGRAVTDTVLKQLRACAARDVAELLPHLTARGEEYAVDAVKKLRDRGEAEAKAMREILETQQKYISETVTKHEKMDDRQRRLNFGDNEDELRQLEANKRHWAKRLANLQHELQTEPDRIRKPSRTPVASADCTDTSGVWASDRRVGVLEWSFSRGSARPTECMAAAVVSNFIRSGPIVILPGSHSVHYQFQSRLALDGAHRRRAADAAHLHDAGRDARALHNGRNLVGQIVHLPVAGRVERELFLADHGSGRSWEAISHPRRTRGCSRGLGHRPYDSGLDWASSPRLPPSMP